MDSVFDFRQWNPTTGGFHGMSEPQRIEVLRALSPIMHVDSGDPPTLLLHGDRDELVPIQQSRRMIDRMTRAEVDCKLFVAEAQNHGWPSPMPGEVRTLTNWLHQHLRIADEQTDEREPE
jgi:dipeptidyl aminopeptidase/acylaminoacyl peptidase